ncbi:hypothetical protein [Pararhodobacter sp.]|uniref:hypothetical protein n=1 Tax=Pararhodobacter sp. TaxID=2127056 RepID=UPI002FDE3221
MIPFARTVTVLASVLAISACAQMPDMRGPAPVRSAPPPVFNTAPGAPGGMQGAAPASAAEQACSQQGQSQGLAVQSVVGTREVSGNDGVARSRDVMLRVARGQQVYEVRCSYSYANGEARIMSL